MKRAFEVKSETFFLVSQVLSFGLTKQISENVADTALLISNNNWQLPSYLPTSKYPTMAKKKNAVGYFSVQ